MSDETPRPADDVPAWLRGPAAAPERYRLDLAVSAEVYAMLAELAEAEGRSVEDVAGELLAEAPATAHKLAAALMELAALRNELRRLGLATLAEAERVERGE